MGCLIPKVNWLLTQALFIKGKSKTTCLKGRVEFLIIKEVNIQVTSKTVFLRDNALLNIKMEIFIKEKLFMEDLMEKVSKY